MNHSAELLKNPLSFSPHGRFLLKHGMYSAALYYKNRNETEDRRAARAARYCLEHIELPPYTSGQQFAFSFCHPIYTFAPQDDPNGYDVDYLIRYAKASKYLTGENYAATSYTWSAYLNCRAAGQEFYGLNANETTAVSNTYGETFIDGVRYVYRKNNTYGVASGVSAFDNVGLTLSYNTETNTAYSETKTKKLVNKLDNPEVYSENLFKGFTTGEVYLSIKASGYQIGEKKANFDIAKIGSDTGLALMGTFDDATAPSIKIEGAQKAENGITIAKGEPFALFDATATDVNLVGGVTKQVYYQYGTPAQSQVGIRDGAFVPVNVGTYTIVYTAKDSFGNEAKETITLNCTASAQKGIQFNLIDEKPTSMYVAMAQTLPAYTVSGLNGEVSVTIAVKYGDQEFSVDTATREFTPNETGDYEVIYRYTDGIKEYEYRFSVVSIATDKIILKSEPVLPKYFIYSGDSTDGYKMKYTLDETYVYKYKEGQKTEELADMYISHDGGAYQKITDYGKVEICGTQTVQFKVVYENQTLFESEVYNLINVGDIFGTTKMDSEKNWIYAEKYFVGDFSSETAEVGITYQSNKSGANSLDFVNVISQSNFTFGFVIPKDFDEFKTMTVSLTDYYDRNNAITVKYTMAEKGYYVQFNDGRNVYVNAEFVDFNHKLSVSGTFFSIIGALGTQKFESWKSFTTDKALLQIAFDGIEENCAIQVKELCETTFSSYLKTDKSAPIISLPTPAGTYAQNTLITIPKACATDVLTPFIGEKLYVELKDEKSNYITAESGVLLNGTKGGCLSEEYQVVLSDIGKYTLVYYAIDQNGLQTAKSTYVIYIADMEAPVLTLDGGYSESTVVTVEKGKQVDIAGYSVTDNNGLEGIRVITTIIDSDNYASVLDGDSFVATKEGLWKVNYYARDEKGNYVLRYYYVNVV